MLIFSMTATFGCLNNETLRLHDGLNILEEANEGGKSTWCAFLRAMFYGLESRKGGALSEKNRYTPWSGAAMRGEMELSWQGQRVTLRRFGKGASPFGGFQAVYTGTEEPVPGLSADNVGEAILGVSKEVFQRTCFIPQGGIQIDGSADLEKRVAALATSGLEEVSFSETERRLKDWRNAIQSNRATGTLPRLRQQLLTLTQQRDKAAALRQRVEDAEGYLRQLEEEKKAVGQDIALHRAHAQQGQQKRLEDARRTLEEKQAQYDLRARDAALQGDLPTQEALRKAQGDLAYLGAIRARLKPAEEAIAQAEDALAQATAERDASPFAPLTAQEAAEKAQNACAAVDAPQKTRLAHWIPMLACAAAALALLVVGLVTKAIHSAILLGVGGGVLAAGIAVSLALSAHGRRKTRRDKAAALEQLQAASPAEISEKLRRYQALCQRAEEAQALLAQAFAAQKSLEEDYDRLWAELTEFCRPFAPEVNSPITLSAALSRALAQEGMLAQAKGELEQARAVFEAVANTPDVPHTSPTLSTTLSTPSTALSTPSDGFARENPGLDGQNTGLNPQNDGLNGLSTGLNPQNNGLDAQNTPLDTQNAEEDLLPPVQRALSEDESMLVRLNHAIALYSDQLSRAQGELAAGGDAAAIEESLSAAEDSIRTQERQHEALTLAMDALSAANATLQSRFSPAVNQAAGEIMSALTGGRYTALSFTREFQALADSGLGLHVSQLLSQGTADQAYLALRLAICRLTFFQDELPPLVLDDALVTFDDTRLGYALELLETLSRDRQVLLFTCQSREGQTLARRNGSHRSHLS